MLGSHIFYTQKYVSITFNIGGIDVSRSFKKNPIIKYAGYGKPGKTIANRIVRRKKRELPVKGMTHRKMYQTWNINDVVSRWTRDEAIQAGMLEEWERLYHRK